MTGYRIFDSMDRAQSPVTATAAELYERCDRLNREADEVGLTITYAIGKILPNGDVTFDC